MKKLVAAAAISGISLFGIAAPAGAVQTFRSCDALHKKFPYGVAKNAKAANRAVREGYSRPSTTKAAKKVYRLHHSNLDRDQDGTACEA